MNIETPLERAIKDAGSLTALANAIGSTRQIVNNWRERGVPVEKCPLIERATQGRVRCEELQPGVAWEVLRA